MLGGAFAGGNKNAAWDNGPCAMGPRRMGSVGSPRSGAPVLPRADAAAPATFFPWAFERILSGLRMTLIVRNTIGGQNVEALQLVRFAHCISFIRRGLFVVWKSSPRRLQRPIHTVAFDCVAGRPRRRGAASYGCNPQRSVVVIACFSTFGKDTCIQTPPCE